MPQIEQRSSEKLALRYRHGFVVADRLPVVTTLPDALLDRADYAILDSSFPSHLLQPGASTGTGSDKSYSVFARNFYDHGRWDDDGLPGPWRAFLQALVADPYQEALGDALHIPPGSVGRIEVRLAEYRLGGWMSRHTDRPDKVYSHLIYMCPGWRPEWGGDLAFYATGLGQDLLTRIRPGIGTSVAFARTDHSWHEVMPVSSVAGRPRRTVLVHGYRA